MPKHDQFDKNQEEGWDPAELDITQILSEIGDYEELGPDPAAMDYDGMTDPALGDVDRILQDARRELDAEREVPQETNDPEDSAAEAEFRDQEYRDAFDEGFERAFQEEPAQGSPETLPASGGTRRRRRRRSGRPAMKKKGTGFLGIPHFLSSLILCGIILAVCVTLSRVVWLWADDVLALTKEEKVVTVTIADTDTMEQITQKLTDAGHGRRPGPLLVRP